MLDLLEFLEQLVDVLGDEMAADWVFFAQIVSLLPLVNIELTVCIVQMTVMVIDPFSDLKVTEADAAGQTSQIVNLHIILPEEFEHLVSVGVVKVEDFLAGNTRVIGAVGNGSGIVVTIVAGEEHQDIKNKIIKYIN